VVLDGSSTILELGTGWHHFYALFLSLFFPAKYILFDVQDNRQLDAIKNRFANALDHLNSRKSQEWPGPLDRAREICRTIASVGSFAELYDKLNLQYVVDPSGSLEFLPNNSVDFVFSIDVLEHVHSEYISSTVGNMRRILKPGGISAHQIGIDDHIQHYVPALSSKEYLRYSDWAWRCFFDSRLQYVNRLQLPEFQKAFENARFRHVECTVDEDAEILRRIHPSPKFRRFDDATLRITRAYIVHEKA
jgi:SAM-dependent methyltransferase